MTALTIGDVATASGVARKTIRYYEDVGLLPRPDRAANGYRVYDDQAVQILRFVRRARDLGFSLDEVSELLDLWSDRSRASSQVKRLAQAHLDRMEQRIAELQSLRDAVQHLVDRCHGDEQPACPILDNLASEEER